jgi:hypothetical protein
MLNMRSRRSRSFIAFRLRLQEMTRICKTDFDFTFKLLYTFAFLTQIIKEKEKNVSGLSDVRQLFFKVPIISNHPTDVARKKGPLIR